MMLGGYGGFMVLSFKRIDINCENDIQANYVQLLEHTVMCNAVRDHVGVLDFSLI